MFEALMAFLEVSSVRSESNSGGPGGRRVPTAKARGQDKNREVSRALGRLGWRQKRPPWGEAGRRRRRRRCHITRCHNHPRSGRGH